MQLPASLLDYVIVNELAHIRQPATPRPFLTVAQRAQSANRQRPTCLAAADTTLRLG
jgi:hypothetical protein